MNGINDIKIHYKLAEIYPVLTVGNLYLQILRNSEKIGEENLFDNRVTLSDWILLICCITGGKNECYNWNFTF